MKDRIKFEVRRSKSEATVRTPRLERAATSDFELLTSYFVSIVAFLM